MSRLTPENEAVAREIIGRYPRAKSALIPLLHLAQEQDGWVSPEAMEHLGELVGITPAEVLGTASFYEMFKLEPVGRYVVNVCTSISCHLCGGDEVLEHAEKALGVPSGGTTPDGLITLQEVECIAACTEAPAAQINYRYRTKLDAAAFDQLVADLREGRVADEVPDHGVLARVRQHIPPERAAGPADPDAGVEPVWLAAGEGSGS